MDSAEVEEENVSDFSLYAEILSDQDAEDPRKVGDLVLGFFDASEKFLEQLTESLETDPTNYKTVDAHLQQFEDLNTCWGAVRVKRSCKTFRSCCKDEKKEWCRVALAQVKQEFFLLKDKLRALLVMQGGALENNKEVMGVPTLTQRLEMLKVQSQKPGLKAEPVLKDDYVEIHPGRRVRADLIGQHSGCHRCGKGTVCRYTVDVLDAKAGTEVNNICCVFLVPPQRAEEWLFTSTRGLWQVLADTKARRLILVTMDGSDHDNDIAHMKADVSQMVTDFLASDCEEIYLTESDHVKFRKTLALVESSTTGPIMVEDVAISKPKKGVEDHMECYRRLSFKRNPNMIQSEARLSRVLVTGNNFNKRKRSKRASSKKQSQAGVFEGLEVDHNFLANDYHEGMIASFVLIANNLEQWLAAEEEIRVMILGLGAGLLPMFVYNHIPVTEIQVVELDEMVGELAKCHFGFVEDDRMKLQIGDGVDAVKAIAASSNLHCEGSPTDSRLHVIIIDTDSQDPSDGSSCPAPECLEDEFLLAGRHALRDDGMLVVNVVASSRKYHADSKAQLKKYFADVFEIEHEKDVCVVLIAMPQLRDCIEISRNMKDLAKLVTVCSRFSPWGRGPPNLTELVRSLRRV